MEYTAYEKKKQINECKRWLIVAKVMILVEFC